MKPARMSLPDVARVGAAGLVTRPLRAFLAAAGIAIGVAAMVAVVGISASSRAGVERDLAAIGTNLLTAAPGQTFGGEPARLPDEAVEMAGRVDGVTGASATGRLDVAVYRSDLMPVGETNGLGVLAARTDLLGPVGGALAYGSWLNQVTLRGPAVVLGAEAARLLGVHRVDADVRLWLSNRWFVVVGVLRPAPLAPELDTAVLVGWPAAETLLGFDGGIGTVYVRTDPDRVTDVRALLARAVAPAHPNEVLVERPSDALLAQAVTDRALTGLLLGLGAVALLVGGVGVANTMIVSVLERRAEVGLRRALGATRAQIRTQFLVESLLLSALGGAAGILSGAAVTGAYAWFRDWPPAVPVWAQAAGLAVTVLIGGVAGLYPAVRAARLPPTEALSVP
ncbi:putative ABC transport system permease protein [Catenuloplanes nepalensis]|uniref:ABC transport system permease protein n=2 Tax=Catenuloplanes nepalensis TaxID=587533 RepID=A0ABT9MQ35_9ACTN|nr:putative ABC transport system permease protein [Catenuloplanes nepalensis]